MAVKANAEFRISNDEFGIRHLAFGIAILLFLCSPAYASVKQEVYVTGTVQSFGGYSVSTPTEFVVTKPGNQEIATVVVDGIYNGEYPWIMRVYTDNLHFAGVGGAIERPSPAGLVSKDGRYNLGLEIHAPTFDADPWRAVPDLSQRGYVPYQPSVQPGEKPHTDCILVGIDPRHADWVAGRDRILFTDDDDPLGNNTVATPFELVFRANIPPNAVQGSYEALIYIEIVASP